VKYYVTIEGEEHEVAVDGSTVSFDGESTEAHLAEVEGAPIRLLTIGERVHRVVLRRGAGRGAYTLFVDGWRFEVDALDERSRAIREASAATGPKGPAPLVAPMPGLIVRVHVQPGDRVDAGQGIVVMEAMKMENELRAAAPGTVKAVHATPGTAVDKGAVLVEME